MASSSSSQVRADTGSSFPWIYDVFLSSRRADTNMGFTFADHLDQELQRQGMRTAIYPEFLSTIEQSRFAIVVLSPSYAASTWCLLELSKIVQCMEKRRAIFPVFYEVDPSDVRNQKGSVAEAFEEHEERFGEGNQGVEEWRDALNKVANLVTGWTSEDYRYESELISEIVQALQSKVLPSLGASQQFVGMDTKLEEIDILSWSKKSSTVFGSSTPQWKYDVFLSFRGGDTCKAFTDNLYTALNHEGIRTFKDDPELQKGEAISPALFAAIEESRFAIIVLSQNYASSTWCLDELVKILQCMKARGRVLPIFYDVDPSDVRKQGRVLPIFYDVDPSDVRKQTGSFREAFANHEQRFWDDNEKVQRWRTALTEVTSFPGWSSKERYESRLIRDIVEVIWTKLKPTSFSYSENLVGMNSRLQPVNLLLGVGVDDVRFIGIWGMGGIGKTTMVRAVYESISHQFEFSFLLTDVRNSVEKGGLLNLQKQLVSGMNRTKQADLICDVLEGATIIRRLFGHKKVLLILDDVNHSSHLKYLAGKQEWFGSGSRVLITTRNEHLLIEHEVERRLKVEELNDDDSLQLFSLKAFKRGYPEENFHGLSKSVISYAQGLPLALAVLGSFFYGRSLSEWNSRLRKLGEVCDLEIFEILKISYNDLDTEEKKMFLDIACFFNGQEKYRATEILTSSYSSATIGIEILMERSLLTVLNGRLQMHDSLREMGHEIVRLESPNELGRRSRLWFVDDVKHVLAHNTGTEAIEGIFLQLDKLEEADWSVEAFSNMNNLRLLCIDNWNLSLGPKYLPNALRFLYWSSYPSKSLPPGFQPYKLTELSLVHSNIDHLWDGIKYLPNLEFINLSYSWKLTSTPDFTCARRVKRLVLEGCTSLVEIHPSIVDLEQLTCLNLKDCRSLKSLPSVIAMKSLEIFILSGCSKFQRIPEFVGSMECLLEFSLDETAIEQLPLSVGLLTGLTSLSLRYCKNLTRLPREIGSLKSLKRLNICGCSNLETLPDSVGKLDCLEELDVAGGCSISNIPSSISSLKNLEVLSLCGCKGIGNMARYPLSFLSHKCDSAGLCSLTELNLSDCNLQEGSIPEELGCLFPLVSLNLSKNNFVGLPKSIRQLSKLRNLNLESCKTLQNLPDLSSSLNFSFGADASLSQEELSSSFNLINCSELVVNQRCNNIAFKMLWRFLQGIPSAGKRFETIIPGREISELFSDQSAGPVISMELPRQWHKNKWMGYAFCVCLVIRQYLPVPANQLGKWKFGTHNSANGLRCEVKPENLGTTGWCPFFACSQELGNIDSEHLWLSFVSGDYFGTAWHETCQNIEFTFKTLGAGLEVKKCGVRLIYEKDLDLIGRKI